jgi:hypothetical protein
LTCNLGMKGSDHEPLNRIECSVQYFRRSRLGLTLPH